MSLFLIYSETPLCIWAENMCIGFFASGLLMTCSSIIGYVNEEERLLREYHWKLSELKEYAMELESIPEKGSSIDTYYYAAKELNILLTNYFAMVDTDFFFISRKKIQKVLEIQTKLQPLKRATASALIKMCKYRCEKMTDTGDRYYSVSELRKDIQGFTKMVDNYDDSGKMLAIWLESKEQEYGEIVFKYNLRQKKDDL